MPVSPRPRTAPMKRVRTWSSVGEEAVAVGDEDAPPAVAVAALTWRDRAALAPAAASSARCSSSTLRGLGDVSGRIADRSSRGVVAGRVSATVRTPPPPPRAAAAAASAAARKPASDRSAVWAKPVVSPRTTRMPAPRSRPGRELLDLAVVERGRRRALVLGEHLGEVAAGAQSAPRGHAADDGFFDHVRPPDEQRACSPASAGSAYGTAVPVKPGLSATIELTVAEDDTARLVALGRRAHARHAPGRRARARRRRRRARRTARARRHERRHAGAARPPRPVPVGVKVRAEATLERVEGRRLSFTVSVNNERGLVAAGKLTRVARRPRALPGKAQ